MTFFLTAFMVSVMAAATPLLLAAAGELVAERAGVLNLGVEGMMLVGAVTGFAVGHATGSTVLGLIALQHPYGRGMAIGGLVCAGIALIIKVIFWVMLLGIFGAAATASHIHSY